MKKEKEKTTKKAGVSWQLRMWKSRYYYLMLLPAVVYVLIFCYAPMGGLQIAFKNYKVSLGMWGSKWIGFRNFTDFFTPLNPH